MADLIIPYDTVRQRYVPQMDEIIDNLRRGKSRERLRPAADLTWKLSYCYSVRMERGLVGLTRAIQERQEVQERQRAAMTFEERLEQELSRYQVVLQGAINRWWGAAPNHPVFIGAAAATTDRPACGTFPPELREKLAEGLREEMEEEARVAAMTPEQREAAANESLRELSRGSGFMMFGVRRNA